LTASTFRTFRLFVLRWHRRVGLVLCFAIIWIATTGIFLNHMHDWKLADKLVDNSWVRQQYAITAPQYYPLDANTELVQAAGGAVFLNQQLLSHCAKPMQGAIAQGPLVVVACPDRLILATATGAVLETVGVGQGLPVPLQGIALDQQRIMLKADRWYAFSDADLSFTPQSASLTPVRSMPLPEPLRAAMGTVLEPQPVSWERLMIDMHTGAFWGENKTLISDIAAVLMMLIAIGGVWVWLTKPGRFRSRD